MANAHRTHPQPNYLLIFVWLTALTAIEVGASYLPGIFPTLEAIGIPAAVLPVAVVALLVILAVAKALLVVMYFMHLRYDSGWYSLVLIISIFFALLFSWAIFKF